MSDPVTMRLKLREGTEALTWEEARRLAHARVAWRMCQREDSIQRDAAIETRRLRHLAWLGRVVAVAILGLTVWSLRTPYRLVAVSTGAALLIAWAIYLSYRSMREPAARVIAGHRR